MVRAHADLVRSDCDQSLHHEIILEIKLDFPLWRSFPWPVPKATRGDPRLGHMRGGLGYLPH